MERIGAMVRSIKKVLFKVGIMRDNRQIVMGIRHDHTTYTEGQEDELEKVLTQQQIAALVRKGSLSGDWSKAETQKAK